MMFEILYRTVLSSTAWLYTVLYRQGYFFVDLWTFPHFWSGCVLMIVLITREARHRAVWLLALLSFYELAELVFAVLAINVFLPEMLGDKANDLLVGLAGGGAGRLLVAGFPGIVARRGSKQRNLYWAAAVSIAMAYFWVGSYGYHYNIEALNSPPLNWWAFVLWTGGLFLTAWFYLSLRPGGKSMLLRLAWTWLGYAGILLLLEFVGYAILGIREASGFNQPAMVLGLIHGTAFLKMFYALAGVMAALLAAGADSLSGAGMLVVAGPARRPWSIRPAKIVADEESEKERIEA